MRNWKLTLGPQGELGLRWKGVPVAVSERPLELDCPESPIQAWSHRLKQDRFESVVHLEGGGQVRLVSRFRETDLAGVSTLVEDREVRFGSAVPRALLKVRVRMLPGEAPRGTFLVLPALWYGDNEAWNKAIPYPKGLGKDWSFRADGSPCPAVILSGKRAAYSLGLESELDVWVKRPGHDDVWGLGFERALQEPTAVLTYPAQEIPRSYPFGRKLRAPQTPRATFQKGQVLRFRLLHQAGPADRAFHAKVWRSRAEGVARVLAYPVDPLRLDETASLFTRCLKTSHWREGQGFSHRHDINEIFSGWCGGFAAAYAAIRWADIQGDAEFRRMGETMADFICREGISPSGIFYSEHFLGRWFEKTVWGKGRGIPMRNPSEGSCYLSLLLEYEQALGRPRASWREALVSNLDAVLGWMRPDGALPQEVDGKTGKPLSWIGTTPGTWAGALAVFSRIDFNRKRAGRYLAAAQKIGAYYLKNYVEAERYIGGPYDTFMAPNMEDPYNLLLAYGELHRSTGRKRWLQAAKRAADHLLSWRYLYDARFPDGTICRREKVRTYAMSPASVSNKHIQNWDSLAGPHLLYLTKETGDPLYADQAVQHLRASTQLVQKGQLPKGIPPGGQSEQWYATEFNWFGDCGPYAKGNLWQVSVVLPKAGFLITMAELKSPFVLGIKPRH